MLFVDKSQEEEAESVIEEVTEEEVLETEPEQVEMIAPQLVEVFLNTVRGTLMHTTP